MSSWQQSGCMVCGDVAIGINFGVPTCAPCKAFFRRNAVKLGKVDFICHEDGDCPVTFQSRRICSCCRLAKCFRVGMKRSLILSDAEREARKELVQQNRMKRARGIMTRSNSSSKVDLISPIIGACSENKMSKYLSTADRELLRNIFNAYEGTCGNYRQIQDQCFPTIIHTSVHEFSNEYADRHQSLVEYFKLIPEFVYFTMDDRIRLLRNHFENMMSINEAILNGSLSNNFVVSVKNLFTEDIVSLLLRTFELISKYKCDPILLKLILVIRTFSSGIGRYRKGCDMSRIFDNSRGIFLAQNIYVELLWRYLRFRLPSEQSTVKFLNRLVLDLLFMHRSNYQVGQFMYQKEQEIKKMEPLLQCMWPEVSQTENPCDTDMEVEFRS